MAVEIRDCREDETADLQLFFGEVYHEGYVLKRLPKLFAWQFGSNPGGVDVDLHVLLALVDGKLVGCLGYIPADVTLSGKTKTGAWTANWMVAAKWRFFGLGPKLMSELFRRFDVVMPVGLNQDAREVLLRMGCTDFGELKRHVCVLDRDSATELTEGGVLDWPTAGFDKGIGYGRSASLEAKIPAESTELWERVWGNGGCGARRTAEMLTWRYVDHPVLSYRVLAMTGGGALEGLAVYRVEPVRGLDARVGRIVELIAGSEMIDPLLTSLVADAREQSVAMLDFFAASERFDEPMAAAGFVSGEATRQIPVLYQPIDHRRAGIAWMAHTAGGESLPPARDWYVTKGDGDQDRPN